MPNRSMPPRPPVLLGEVRFPGHNLFTDQQKIILATDIRNLQDNQPLAVRNLMSSSYFQPLIGSSPDAAMTAEVERLVKLRGGFVIASKTAQFLGEKIPKTKELLKVLQSVDYDYQEIPQAVYNYFHHDSGK